MGGTDAEPIEAPARALVGVPRAEPADAALVRAAQRGSEEAFARLFARHWPMAHRAAWLVVRDAAAAEDVAQEAFVSAARALQRFDRRRPFAPWLHRIVVNRAIDAARARRVRAVVGEPVEALLATEAAPEARGALTFSEGVVAALAELSPEHRAVVVLRHLLEYTPGEIARLLDLPRGTVNSRLRRALDALEPALREEGRP
jgi:RNA polymerase sigma-70 factor, ECF subfamily